MLKRKARQTVRYRGGEHVLDGFPKRIDVHRPVQAEQGPFQGRIDHRFALHANPGGPLHLPVPAPHPRGAAVPLP